MMPAPTLPPREVGAVLSATLREASGDHVTLEDWHEEPLVKRGRGRVVRYDVVARVPGVIHPHRYQWVGKFYDRDQDARIVAAVLRDLRAVPTLATAGVVVPRVIAYYASRRLLVLSFEHGHSVVRAIGRAPETALGALARALAALHAVPILPTEAKLPAALLADLQPRVAQLCDRFPGHAGRLRQELHALEREVPTGRVPRAFLHGDLGPSQLLWQDGRIVVLDLDKCGRGDPALDLGNLLTQLRRLTLRKPGKLGDFATVRGRLLGAYRSWAGADSELSVRVAWYERVALLRKVHFLASGRQHAQADSTSRRSHEAAALLGEYHSRVP